MILLACSLAMLITVYTCGTAATGDKVRAWVTVLLLLALLSLLQSTPLFPALLRRFRKARPEGVAGAELPGSRE